MKVAHIARPHRRNSNPKSPSTGYIVSTPIFDHDGQEWPLQKPDLMTSVTINFNT